MKINSAIFSLFFLAAASDAATNAVTKVNWSPEVVKGGAVFQWLDAAEGERILEISNQTGRPSVIQLGVVEGPVATGRFYAVEGRVQYTDVQGQGFLEMMNHFPGVEGGQPMAYFSRTLSQKGLLQQVSGGSEWRDFRLPFMKDDDTPQPGKLVISLHLPGTGTVQVTGGTLRNYPSRGALMSEPGLWWPAHWSSWIGAGVGITFGCWGSLLGILSQIGRGRGFVSTSVLVNIVVGMVALILGLAAVVMNQPYHIYYPLLLIGVLLTCIMLGMRKNLMRQFSAAEERKMAAMDAVPH